MIKIIIGFVIFSALAIFILMKGGDIDMSGEKHGIEEHPPAKTEAPAPASAPAAAPTAPAATNEAPAAPAAAPAPAAVAPKQ
jgi:hypothetical protein